VIRHALLALLREQPDYGYRLKQRFDERVGRAWQLNVGQVYQTLHALARSGLVREIPNPDAAVAQSRRVFEITPKGARALERWLRRPATRLRPIRHDLLLRLLCVAPDQYRDVLHEVDAQEQACRQQLDALHARRARALRQGAPPLAMLALEAELLHAAMQIEWLGHCREVLGGWPSPATSPSVAARDDDDPAAPRGAAARHPAVET